MYNSPTSTVVEFLVFEKICPLHVGVKKSQKYKRQVPGFTKQGPVFIFAHLKLPTKTIT